MAKELSRQAEERFGAPDEVLAFFVHELRNPLAVIKGYASALQESGPSPDPALVTASAGAIERAVGTLNSLVSSLGSAAPLLGLDVDLEPKQVLTSVLVEETVADVKPISNDHPLCVAIEDDAVVRVDPVKIRQVLMNLVSNAVKFSPDGSAVEIVVSRKGDRIQIRVMDEGPGIPGERLDELFQKFSRLGSSKDGTGLGLYISRGIARAHGGDLELGRTDEGCHFKLTLPIHAKHR
jgi:signal transduction histidine kinase